MTEQKPVAFIAGGVFAWLVNNTTPLVQALFLLSVLDIISGLLKASITSTLSSGASYKGMLKKAYMLLIVAVGWIAQHKVGLDFGVPVDSVIAGAFCMTEILSILENAKASGVSVPGWLFERFANADKGRSDTEETQKSA